MGLPIVATDIRGCRQVVDHEVTGLLVPPRDPAGLARAIARLASDARTAHSHGDGGRGRRPEREFDQQRCIDITLATL
jgi:glycosyltransferase involved in cell wall biosynthesis